MRWLFTFLLGLTLLCVGGCSHIVAPFMLLENQPQTIRATITDDAGAPLDGVTVEIAERRNVLDLVAGYRPIEKTRTVTTNSDFICNTYSRKDAWGLWLTFSKPGYYPMRVSVGHELWQLVEPLAESHRHPRQRDDTSMKIGSYLSPFNPNDPVAILQVEFAPQGTKILPIKLVKQNPATPLYESEIDLWVRGDGSSVIGAVQKNAHVMPITLPANGQTPPGSVTLDVIRRPDGSPVLLGNFNELPPRLQVSAGGDGNGFIPAKLAIAPSLERQLRQAPAEGYAPLILYGEDFEDLRFLSYHGHNRARWYYVRFNGFYGRAKITTLVVNLPTRHNQNDGSVKGIMLHLQAWLQPDGSRNLEALP